MSMFQLFVGHLSGPKAEHQPASKFDTPARFTRGTVPKGRHPVVRLLCLHGYGSNNDISKMHADFLHFNDKGKHVVCDFYSGSIEVDCADSTLALFSKGPFRAWKPGFTLSNADLESSFRDIMRIVQKYGPYDGVYGFSQGSDVYFLMSLNKICPLLVYMKAC
jgi:hypothetical protein